jgi:tetratricopeptide (TPR) repeat protein
VSARRRLKKQLQPFGVLAFSIGIVLCLIVSAFAQTPQSIFKQANLYYENKDYQKALETYEKIVADNTVTSADLFYNIGNCYFKLNDLGYALVNYKRAHLLRPRDFFIKYNLVFTRSLVDYTIEDKRAWYIPVIEKWLGFFTDLEWSILFLTGLGLLLVAWMCVLMFPNTTVVKSFKSFTLMITLVLALIVVVNKFVVTDFSSAVVVDNDVKAHSGPVSSESIVFRLVQGLELTILEVRGDWYKIRLNNDSLGWVRSAHIQPVYPQFFQSETI